MKQGRGMRGEGRETNGGVDLPIDPDIRATERRESGKINTNGVASPCRGLVRGTRAYLGYTVARASIRNAVAPDPGTPRQCPIPSRWIAAICLCLGALSPSFAGETVSGGTYSLVGGPVAGGGVASGGGFSLDASAGDFAPGLYRGAAYELIGTLYGVASVAIGDVTMTIRDLGDGRVRMEWPATAVEYVLESAPAVGEPGRWQPVVPGPAGNTHTLTTAGAGQFFRLRRQ